jgi:TRAP transporter 4TM/12TM fusion protein
MIEIDDNTKARHLSGLFRGVERLLLISIPSVGILFVADIHIYLRQVFFREQYLAIFLGLILGSIYLSVPATRASSKKNPPWYDIILALLGLGIGVFTAVVYPEQIYTGIPQSAVTYRVIGLLCLLLVIEATRRITGWVFVVIIGVLMFYAHFAYLFPAPFFGKGIPWQELIVYLYMDNSALLGLPLWVSGVILFAFILLGVFLFATGARDVLNDFALASFGRFRGGPAKVAVVASSLFGTISGSAVSNVAATGVMTIPLMKETGYKPTMAGAIEAAASTGGQLMPPVMGVTAFVIAEFLGIPYSEVAIASILPAILYYLALFIQVDLLAARSGIRGVTEKLPPIWPALKKSWLLFLPLLVLIYTLFFLYFQPGKSALIAAASLFVLSYLTRQNRIGLRTFLNILERAGRDMLMIGAITATAGIIIGLIYITGLGSIISLILLKVGGKNLFLMLLITAVLCIFLGMGMPTVSLYIILAVLVAPALTEMGIIPIAAHLFIFYFGLMSMVTPPVCFAAYAGAGIAKADPMQTGFYAMLFGIAAYVVPFLFVYSPALLLRGSMIEILLMTAKSLIGFGFLAAALSGFLLLKLDWGLRTLIVMGSLCILFPTAAGIFPVVLVLNIGGLIFCCAIVVWQWRRRTAMESISYTN